MNLAAIAEAEELYVRVFVAATFKHACQSLAAEATQLAWRKCLYSPDSLFCKKLMRSRKILILENRKASLRSES